AAIEHELEMYNPELMSRPRIIAANKIDMMSDETKEKLQNYADKNGLPIFFMCAGIGEGVRELADEISVRLKKLPPLKIYEAEIDITAAEDDIPSEEITVSNKSGVYYVESERLINVVNSINFSDRESFAYFEKVLRNAGVFEALEENGINEGDLVNIYGAEFEYYR
ncbi:MAG: Obg family GTPase CgtA, partial [Clostridia bacterium]|nr:Obg family GTPase CgtA [Clostridia bacterium]